MSSVVTDLGALLHTLPPELKSEVRKLEKVSSKLCKSECRVLFNSLCVRENLLPNYSNIYIYIYIYSELVLCRTASRRRWYSLPGDKTQVRPLTQGIRTREWKPSNTEAQTRPKSIPGKCGSRPPQGSRPRLRTWATWKTPKSGRWTQQLRTRGSEGELLHEICRCKSAHNLL